VIAGVGATGRQHHLTEPASAKNRGRGHDVQRRVRLPGHLRGFENFYRVNRYPTDRGRSSADQRLERHRSRDQTFRSAGQRARNEPDRVHSRQSGSPPADGGSLGSLSLAALRKGGGRPPAPPGATIINQQNVCTIAQAVIGGCDRQRSRKAVWNRPGAGQDSPSIADRIDCKGRGRFVTTC